MSSRSTPLITNEIYHLFNRSIARQPVLTEKRDLQRFFEVIDFYRFRSPLMRFSHYNRLLVEQKTRFIEDLYKTNNYLVEIYAFSFMPNHFHLFVKQNQDNGIKLFMSQIQNSYAKYYNTKHKRVGSLFQEMFKAVRIETEEQLVHVARYIHLNPLTSFILKNPEELHQYLWTSFFDYSKKRQSSFVNTNTVLSYFRDLKDFTKFTIDQVNYQRELKKIQHLLFT